MQTGNNMQKHTYTYTFTFTCLRTAVTYRLTQQQRRPPLSGESRALEDVGRDRRPARTTVLNS